MVAEAEAAEEMAMAATALATDGAADAAAEAAGEEAAARLWVAEAAEVVDWIPCAPSTQL